MFSHRLPENLEPNEFSKLLARKRAEGARLLDLTESNPTRAGLLPEVLHQEILAAISGAQSLVYEPNPLGIPKAREAIAAYYATEGEKVDPDRIVLTASTSEAYSFLFKLLADPGESFMVPTPSYPLFDLLASLEDVALVPYRLVYPDDALGWRLDIEGLPQEIGPTTQGLILVNPNNPTGSCLRVSERQAIEEMCAERGLAILCDEVFSPYIGDYMRRADADIVRSMVSTKEGLCFSMSGLSKICALPQLKLGWIILSGADAEVSAARRRLELVSDTYLSVGTPVQHAAGRLLKLAPIIQQNIRDRIVYNQRMTVELKLEGPAGKAIRPLKSDGGWCVVLELPSSRSDEAWALTLLEDENVVVHPGYFFGFEGGSFLVVSLLTDREPFEEGFERLVRRVHASA